jgi:phage shock protein C
MTDRYPGNPHRLHRNPEAGWIMGVCAGLADYFGVNRGLVRILAIVALVLFNWLTLVAYFVLAFSIGRKPVERRHLAPEEDQFWREVSTRPTDTLTRLRQRFRDIERRVVSLEGRVTSPDFELRRQFRDLR